MGHRSGIHAGVYPPVDFLQVTRIGAPVGALADFLVAHIEVVMARFCVVFADALAYLMVGHARRVWGEERAELLQGMGARIEGHAQTNRTTYTAF